ncbi:BamA/OMP85 family outer membrane protein [Vulgatibacter incomptus]|uniref:Outer membrane protein n=1 Tax=Vulgatibacter incomptus TaxID=1391653 RepID=A0A0K1PGS6_9BACT|nr:BamA/TamA family outer membrane protein [Vulgatibacter incomptus]AKU92324.1 Outer membrane protein [Vulgatibacter incomptus]
MIARSGLLGLLGLLCLGACAHVDREREILGSLRFEGNEALSPGDLEPRLALAETPIWPWADRQYFDAGTLVGDRRRLVRYYQAEGFHQAKVRSRVSRTGAAVDVTFLVEEGAPTRIRTLRIDGLPDEVRDRVLEQPLPIREEARIREVDYDAAKGELIQRLRNQGYADATVSGSVGIDAAQNAADVRLLVAPGPPLRFGRVVITGAVQVPRQTILERVREVIPEGRSFSETRMADAQARLFDMGVFGGVRVSRGPTDASTRTVPLIVSVREAPFQTLRAGGGFGVDKERVEGRAIAQYTNRNFLGGLRTLRFDNRLGYAFVGEGAIQLNPTEQGVVGSSALDLLQPELFRHVDGNFRLEYEHGLESAYLFDSVRGRVGFPVRLHRSLVFTTSYNLQFFALQPFTETGGSTSTYSCVDERGNCVLSFLEERLTWDRRDNPLETTSGWLASIALQQGGGFLGGRASYNRVLGEARYFLPLPRAMVLALKLEGGAILPASGEVSPIMERFYAGGGSSLRAFGTRRLAPQKLREGRSLGPDGQVVENGTLRPLQTSDAVPVGGDTLLDASAELRFPIAGDLGLAAFVDAGNVGHTLQDSNVFSPNVAVGLGLRYRTPFGPIRLDAGYRVLTVLPRLVAPDETLTTVAVPETPFSLHFSIGEAF